tara:strand:+ start:377 stop:787 length:411 start_codon:yes stop_codon:yes gene_type:complete
MKPRLKLNKKGSSVLFIIFEILVVVIIVQAVFQVAAAYGDSVTIRKVQMANDLVLMVNHLVATPGDVKIEYPGDSSNYLVTLHTSSVEVSIEGDEDVNIAVRVYSLPQGYEAKGTVSKVENLCLVKDDNLIKVEEC